MFTTIAVIAAGVLAWWSGVGSVNERDRVSHFEDSIVRQSIVFVREDIKLIAFLLVGILVMLGIIADKLK